jgi:hypothetical protein
VDGSGGTPRKSDQPWVWAAAVAAALVILAAGAIIGMTTSSGGDEPSAAPGTGAVETAPTGVPPTVTVPQATGPATEPGATQPGGAGTTTVPGATTSPGATTAPGATTTSPFAGFEPWPPDKDGYTVVLSSVAQSKGQEKAVKQAQKAKNAGLPQVGVLSSSAYSTLNPGFWVVFSGIYDSLTQASTAVGDARAAGFPDAYPRNVAP